MISDLQLGETEKVKKRLLQTFDYLYEHEGFGHFEVDVRILKRGQKEVLIRCGREYRFVIDSAQNSADK